MYSGNRNRIGERGYVRRRERRRVVLKKILQIYSEQGYDVWELPKSNAIENLSNGNFEQWLLSRAKEEKPDLEAIMSTGHVATALNTRREYIASPKGFDSLKREKTVYDMVVQYAGKTYSAQHFVVGTNGIFLKNIGTDILLQLRFSEFYDVVKRLHTDAAKKQLGK